MTRVWVAVLTLMCLESCMQVGTAPLCAYGQAGCHVPSLVDLFARVMQQSSRMHSVSGDLHTLFREQDLFPSKNIIGRWKCHTHEIVTPEDKENAQRLGREHLTEVILRLLGAWRDPLSQLYQSMSKDQNQDFNHHGFNKLLEMSDMVQELRDGVLKMTEKMKLLGVLGNTVSHMSLDRPAPSALPFYRHGELNSMDHSDLLYCFLRDSNKVKNYLRILQCTTLPDLDC